MAGEDGRRGGRRRYGDTNRRGRERQRHNVKRRREFADFRVDLGKVERRIESARSCWR